MSGLFIYLFSRNTFYKKKILICDRRWWRGTVNLSALFPDKMILGMEIRDRVVDYVQKRIAKLQKDNPGTRHSPTPTGHACDPSTCTSALTRARASLANAGVCACRPIQEHRLRSRERDEALAQLVREGTGTMTPELSLVAPR
jgi:hypothetical protein